MIHVIAILLLPAIYAIWAICAVQIWEWHIMPMFGLPALTFWAAIGISCFVHLFRSSSSTLAEKEQTEAQKITKIYLEGFIRPLLLLGIAWIAK